MCQTSNGFHLLPLAKSNLGLIVLNLPKVVAFSSPPPLGGGGFLKSCGNIRFAFMEQRPYGESKNDGIMPLA